MCPLLAFGHICNTFLKMLDHVDLCFFLYARVVIRGTSSKKSLRNFVPSTDPGTHELALSGRKLSTKVCLSACYQYSFHN